MVVVSGSWVKNVATYPTPPSINNDMVISNDNNQIMAAKAILICRPNSHQFQDRTLVLDQPVKVGRSVARAKASPTNAIFDCKVLSRHHAMLWYENGKFYLQDTKSSNGTFVNNNRLAPESENHEVSSGDIVQFGVDVLENNKKVTHGCIIATLKLYLPDGKEAKASPITDGDRHGMVPLDDLYRLNQIIQDANQREQCLETKLAALQNVVEETKRSTEESWQTYVGEERLLSRLSALEQQIQQNSKNWGEDRLREELSKLQDHNDLYQVAAKEALDKLHVKQLEALASATEQERARITAEQESLLAKEQLAQVQLELESLAQKLFEEQKKFHEEKSKLVQRESELMAQLEAESNRFLDLQLKLLPRLSISEMAMSFEELEKNNLIYKDDLKAKEEMLAENEMGESDLNKSNGMDQNHISLTVGPVDQEISNEEKNDTDMEEISDESMDRPTSGSSLKEDSKHVTFKLPVEDLDTTTNTPSLSPSELSKENNTKDDYVDSKTLKYQFQSAQNELKRKIEVLETISQTNKLKIVELDRLLNEEKELTSKQYEENESLKEELLVLKQKWKESCNENQQLRDKVAQLSYSNNEELPELRNRKEKVSNSNISNDTLVTYDQVVNLEEELVLLKERFAQVGDEKVKLQRDLVYLTEQYNTVYNRSCNKTFFYFAPLVLMVLYLLVSAMIS